MLEVKFYYLIDIDNFEGEDDKEDPYFYDQRRPSWEA